MPSSPLIDADYLLQKFPGKGGWWWGPNNIVRLSYVLDGKYQQFSWQVIAVNSDTLIVKLEE
ncbi:MAG: hypothetical protein R3B47_16005 [Bacteroidia bacterium]